MNPPSFDRAADRAFGTPAAVEAPAPSGAITLHGAKLGLLALTCVIYLVVSGGAYGTEDAVRIAGPRLTLLLCVMVPLTLSIPTALMAAELNALMPLEGGFYFWVKEALGPFWVFAEAYLTMLYTAVDMAIYPVLFSAYLAVLYPLGTAAQVVVGVTLVWLAGLLNFLGIRPAGDSAVGLTALLLAPFAAMVVLGFGHLIHWQPPGGHLFGPDFSVALGGGLTIIIWNFSGWENASVLAGEGREPRRRMGGGRLFDGCAAAWRTGARHGARARRDDLGVFDFHRRDAVGFADAVRARARELSAAMAG